MTFQRSDYGPNPHEGAERNNAEERGWGTGWPNCQFDKWVIVERAGVRVSVRREIAELVAVLFTATEETFKYDIKDGQTWGAACRAIRGTSTASNHSWALAVDINSLSNPMGSTFVSDIPPPVVHMWEACGFYWGGRYLNRPDAMHFEYIGKPVNVDFHLNRARSFIEKDWFDMADRDMLENVVEKKLDAKFNEAWEDQLALKIRSKILHGEVGGGNNREPLLRKWNEDNQRLERAVTQLSTIISELKDKT